MMLLQNTKKIRTALFRFCFFSCSRIALPPTWSSLMVVSNDDGDDATSFQCLLQFGPDGGVLKSINLFPIGKINGKIVFSRSKIIDVNQLWFLKSIFL